MTETFDSWLQVSKEPPRKFDHHNDALGFMVLV